MAVDDDIDVLGLEHAQVDLSHHRPRGAEKDVLQFGGDHAATPTVGQSGPGPLPEDVVGVSIHTDVGAVHDLHDLAVDAPGHDAFPPPPCPHRLRSHVGEDDLAFLLTKLGQAKFPQLDGDVLVVPALDLDARLGSHLVEFALVLDLVAWGLALDRGQESGGHVAAVVGVGGGATGDHADEVAGHDGAGRGSADALISALSEGVDAAGPHEAVSAADAQFPEAALRLLRLVALPNGLRSGVLRDSV